MLLRAGRMEVIAKKQLPYLCDGLVQIPMLVFAPYHAIAVGSGVGNTHDALGCLRGIKPCVDDGGAGVERRPKMIPDLIPHLYQHTPRSQANECSMAPHMKAKQQQGLAGRQAGHGRAPTRACKWSARADLLTMAWRPRAWAMACVRDTKYP